MKKLWLLAAILILAFFVTACSGDTTNEDPEGNNNVVNEANDTEEPADTEDPVTSSDLGSLEVVSAISAEWLTAGHANVSEPLSYAGIRGTCSVCHSGNALERYGSDDPYTAKGIEGGEVRGTFVVDGHEAELPSPMGCATCHAGPGAEIAQSGVIPADLASAFGGEEFNVGSSNALCLTCHNARRDVDGLYEAYVNGEAGSGDENNTEYPHHGWSSLASGQGGIEYPDVDYAQSEMHLDTGCTGCHMGETEDGYSSHTFAPSVETCQSCHPDATDIESLSAGLAAELEEELAKLEELVLANIPGAVEIGMAHGTTPAINADGEAISPENIPAEALIGAYNWAVIAQELELGGKGVHNPKYAKALISESIAKLEALQ